MTRRSLLVLAFSLAPRLAFAHVEPGAAAGFASGFGHPLTGWDHVLAMVAVGLWGRALAAWSQGAFQSEAPWADRFVASP
jgi:urease accessory protein